MAEFRCKDAGAACDARLWAPDKEELMRQVARHWKEVHRVEKPTQTIMSYLERMVR